MNEGRGNRTPLIAACALDEAKTAEIDAAKKELTALLAETRKLVKIAVDKTDWLTFGISDKK